MMPNWNKRIRLESLAALVIAAAGISSLDAQVVDRDSVLAHGAQGHGGRISQDLMSVVESLKALDAQERLAFQDAVTRAGNSPMFVTRGAEADQIEVYIRVADKSEEFLNFLRDSGVNIQFVSRERPLVQALVGLSRLDVIAKIPGVVEITRPEYAIATAGRVTTEGDLRMGTNLVRSLTGIDGTGTTVLVLSNALYGFNQGSPTCNSLQRDVDATRPAGLRTELPIGRIWPNCDAVPEFGWFGDIEIFPRNRPAHASTHPAVLPEGAAMLEIIHDVAPGARLLYGSGRTTIELEESRQHYGMPRPGETTVNEFGIDVIVDNLFFTGVGRYDGSSLVSRQAERMGNALGAAYIVTGGGATPFNASGMSTDSGSFPIQISGFFNGDPRFNILKTHNWNPATTTTNRDEGLAVRAVSTTTTVPGTELVNVGVFGFEATLVWDDVWNDAHPRATLDLDMYLVPRNTLNISQAIASSTRIQNGNGANPVERITFLSFSNPGAMALVIVNKSVDQNPKPFFTLTIERGILDDVVYVTNPVPLNNTDARGNTITVGSIDIRAALASNAIGPEVVPGLSPRNSPTGGFLKWYSGQSIPTVVGLSSVSTASIPIFRGPSAATAHIGGVAALMRHQSPGIAPDRLKELLTDTSGLDDDGREIAPLATNVTPASLAAFPQPPTYIRPNPFVIINGVREGFIDPYAPVIGDSREIVKPGPDGVETDWIHVPDPSVLDFDPVIATATERGLELRATSSWSAGSWTSPVLTIEGEDGKPTTQLRADRVYMFEARVGTDCADATRIPNFRLRVTTTRFDEAANLQVNSIHGDIANAPNSVDGKVYRLFYQPSSEAVAADGFRFHLDVLSFNVDDDINCSLILREFSFTELSEVDSLGLMN